MEVTEQTPAAADTIPQQPVLDLAMPHAAQGRPNRGFFKSIFTFFYMSFLWTIADFFFFFIPRLLPSPPPPFYLNCWVLWAAGDGEAGTIDSTTSAISFDPMEEEVEMAGFVLKTPALETPPEAANNGLQIPSLNVIPSTPVRSRSPVQSSGSLDIHPASRNSLVI